MKKMIKILCVIIPGLVIWLLCSQEPAKPEEQNHSLRLSLETEGRDTAVFSGTPIKAIITSDDTVSFDTLNWHTGMGNYYFSSSNIRKRDKLFDVWLHWIKYPLKRDTADNIYFDSIYVTIGGRIKISNAVKVKVANLPVRIDSIRVGTSLFLATDSICIYKIPDTMKVLPLNLYPRDLDGKEVSLNIIDKYNRLKRTINPYAFLYSFTEAEFNDTLYFTITDGLGAKAMKSLIIRRIPVNIPPVIDSVTANGIVITSATVNKRFYFKTIDTIKLSVNAHDPDKNGIINRYTWTAGQNKIELDSSSSNLARYICQSQTCYNETNNNPFLLDYIMVSAVDNRNDSTTWKIDIFKGPTNHSPVIDSVKAGPTTFKTLDSIYAITLSGNTTYNFAVFAQDSDNNKLITTWSVKKGIIKAGLTDSTIVYQTPSTMTPDTMKISVSDNDLKVNKYILISINDIIPSFDSLTIKDSIYIEKENVYNYSSKKGDTLTATIYYKDFDVADSLKYVWSAGKATGLILKTKNRAKYVVSVSDTLSVVSADGTWSEKKSIIIKITP
jgi:hypothetical protein